MQYEVPVVSFRTLGSVDDWSAQVAQKSWGVVAYDERAAMPMREMWGHEAPPRSMNVMAQMVEATIMMQASPWQWIPDTPIAHRGNTRPIVETAPWIDVNTQKMLGEPRSGFRGVYPYDAHSKVPFPNPWE